MIGDPHQLAAAGCSRLHGAMAEWGGAAPHASVDPYGFERPEDFDYDTYDDFMTNYLSVLSRRAKKWHDMLEGDKNVKRSVKVKRYVRKGIPREHRGQVWMEISGALAMKNENPDLYSTILNGPKNQELIDTVKLDIPRTFPDNIYFKHTSDGKQKPLFNVLVALAHHRPHIGYCQGLNFIAGILLLITECEETTFWLLVILVDKILPDYYTREMTGLLTDIEVMAEIVRQKAPDIHHHVDQLGGDWPIITTKWFICLFAEVLPIETVLRIWDSLFYEGSKILFRVAVTLILKSGPRIMEAGTFAEVVAVFKDITRDMLVTDCHMFMQMIFKEPGSLPMSLISKLRTKCREKVLQDQRNGLHG